MVAQAAASQLLLCEIAVDWRMSALGFTIYRMRRGRHERWFPSLGLMPVKPGALQNC